MAETESVKAHEVAVGDKIFLPASRRARTVDDVSTEPADPSSSESSQVIKIRSGDTTWVVPSEFEVRKEITE